MYIKVSIYGIKWGHKVIIYGCQEGAGNSLIIFPINYLMKLNQRYMVVFKEFILVKTLMVGVGSLNFSDFIRRSLDAGTVFICKSQRESVWSPGMDSGSIWRTSTSGDVMFVRIVSENVRWLHDCTGQYQNLTVARVVCWPR